MSARGVTGRRRQGRHRGWRAGDRLRVRETAGTLRLPRRRPCPTAEHLDSPTGDPGGARPQDPRAAASEERTHLTVNPGRGTRAATDQRWVESQLCWLQIIAPSLNEAGGFDSAFGFRGTCAGDNCERRETRRKIQKTRESICATE